MVLENPLWAGVCALYGKPGVAQACLALQGQGYSVNSLLTSLWCGLHGRQLGQEAEYFDHWPPLQAWRKAVTEPVREARFGFRSQTDKGQLLTRKDDKAVATMYDTFKSLELGCEQLEVALIYASLQRNGEQSLQELPDKSAQFACIRENLATYLNAGKLSPDFCFSGDAEALLHAAYELTEGAVKRGEASSSTES